VGGQGGSLTIKHFKDIIIPLFSETKQKEIALLYHKAEDYPCNLNLENFLEKEQNWNEKVGIIELDKSIKQIKEHINKNLDKIINNEKVEIDFSFKI
jgi:hypothetical protein